MQHYRSVDNAMRPYPEIAANWAEAGITPDKWVAFYCGTGWRASETWFYAWIQGWSRIAVYDGGWFEWSQDPVNNPIEVGLPTGEPDGEVAGLRRQAWPVGRDDDAGARSSTSSARSELRERPRPRRTAGAAAQDQRVDLEGELVDEIRPQQRPEQLAAAEDQEVPARFRREAPDRVDGVVAEELEFAQPSGSFSVVEATYFRVALRNAPNGLSGWFGQTAAKSSYVTRPEQDAPVSAMPDAAARLAASSA